MFLAPRVFLGFLVFRVFLVFLVLSVLSEGCRLMTVDEDCAHITHIFLLLMHVLILSLLLLCPSLSD
jgi:hypothetical protein